MNPKLKAEQIKQELEDAFPFIPEAVAEINKQIIEFMNYNITVTGRWENVESSRIIPEFHEYDKNFNWLMPVVNKVFSIVMKFPLAKECRDEIKKHVLNADISQAYMWVGIYAELYNYFNRKK